MVLEVLQHLFRLLELLRDLFELHLKNFGFSCYLKFKKFLGMEHKIGDKSEERRRVTVLVAVRG